MEIASKYNPAEVEGKWYQYWLDNGFFKSKPDGREPYTCLLYTSAQLVKEVASKTNDNAGDGTTTATVLAQSIIGVGLKNVTAGANPMDLKRGIDKAVAKVVESIANQAEAVGDKFEKIEHVAKISANGDEAIGKLIAEAIDVYKRQIRSCMRRSWSAMLS